MNRVIRSAEFALIYLREVIKSNLEVAIDVITPSYRMRPATVELDVSTLTDRQLMAYANLITMTPGTLSLDVSSDQKKLLIHAMYVSSAEQLTADLEKTLKERIVDVF